MTGSILDIPRDEIDIEPWIDGREAEFKGLTDEQIKDKLIDEAIEEEHMESERKSIQATIDAEEAMDSDD